MSAEHHSHKKTYFIIFVVLLVLTLLEVGVVYLDIPQFVIRASLVIMALAKAACVGLWYMHLKWETKTLKYVALLPLPIATFYAVFLMLEVVYR